MAALVVVVWSGGGASDFSGVDRGSLEYLIVDAVTDKVKYFSYCLFSPIQEKKIFFFSSRNWERLSEQSIGSE